ncbi:MAG TPA: SgcJ/EcaC family oxidoreductase [Pirellulales bacterium]|jgi:uncharacterized protein (TIGR02246 family)
MMARTKLFVLPLLIAGGVAVAMAADDAKPSGDEAAIRKSIESYVDAFNHGDAAALARHWSEKGIYVQPHTGQRVTGRAAIAKLFAGLFAEDKPPQLSLRVESIRFLDENVAIEEGVAMVYRGADPPDATNYIAIHVQRDGHWQLDSVRETEAPAQGSKTSPLAELDWMVGSWLDQDDHAKVETVCKWTANKAFLSRSFTIETAGGEDLAGTQIVGWDPAGKRIRSWVFDSDGGFGEGIWTQEGDRWLIKVVSTLPDGKKATALQIITKLNDHSFTWESKGREVDGELLPNVDPITVVRQTSDD